jgi:predicted nucleic acid-binding protein
MFLLDTNVISELRRPEKANSKVVAWSESVRQAELYLSVITILEVEAGILLIEHRNDHAQAATMRIWMDRIRQSFASRILPVLLCVAPPACAGSTARRDALIAATALVGA